MTTQFNANVSIAINAASEKVWDALVNPSSIKHYMFGTDVSSTWKEGAPIAWKGEWQGKSYEDKGIIKRIKPYSELRYTHFSPLTGLPDIPENYHTVTIYLSSQGKSTQVSLSQDNNPTLQGKEHSEKNWKMMLEALKKFVEQ